MNWRLNLCALLGTAIVFGGGATLALAVPQDKPPSPPGQGPCGHGNSQKPCKEDPQPDKGKDCDEHGPKEGGVNEDHCKGETPTTPTETTPTETTPTETTPTTPEPETPTTPEAPSTTPTPDEPTGSPEEEEAAPSEEEEASPPTIVKVTPGDTPEEVIVHLSDGTTRVGIKGQG